MKANFDGIDRIPSIEELQGFVRSAPSFTDQPLVIDGDSELLIEPSW